MDTNGNNEVTPYNEAMWKLWSYLWSMYADQPVIGTLALQKDPDDANEEISNLLAYLGIALVATGLVDDKHINMTDHPIPRQVFANIGDQAVTEIFLAPYYWGLRAYIASRKDPHPRAASFGKQVWEGVQELYDAWDLNQLNNALLNVYPDAFTYIRQTLF